ncbi:MAG: bifunctional 4-hydroxy-2-oxoglutarate aldolase/2-dehydro-3-deoxy-phosphogluconate aldolase [Promethearchaeia archaeon]
MEKILQKLKKNPLIAVVAIPSPHLAVPLSAALLRGGVNCIEITFRNENAAEALYNIRDAGKEIIVGAGTVRTKEDAQNAIDANVDFMVSPGLNKSVIKYVQNNSPLPFFPGVDSTLGIETAYKLGIKTLKYFPASVVGGVKWLKSMKGPYYDINFMPTGGVGLDNLEDYLRLPNVLACGGSFLARSHLIIDENWAEITQTAKKAVEIVNRLR